MKEAVALVIVLFVLMSLAGCNTDSSAAWRSNVSQADYDIVGMLTLNVGNGIKSQATIESLKDSVRAIPGQRPRSRLVIKNLSTGRIIYQEECGDSTLSYPGFDIGQGAGLVLTTQGGSADGIRVFEVTESEVKLVLAEGYRAAAITMPNDELGGDGGFLIVDSENDGPPLIVKRYQYDKNSKKYALTGKTAFADFIRSVKAQFVRADRPR